MADQKTEYQGQFDLTITLNGLATSSTLVAGQEATALDNTTPSTRKYLDWLVGGEIRVHATLAPAAGARFELWAGVPLDWDLTPVYPDTLTGINGARTLTSVEVKLAALKPLAAFRIAATADITYPIAFTSLRRLFGAVPPLTTFFATQSTGNDLHVSSGGRIQVLPVYATT